MKKILITMLSILVLVGCGDDDGGPDVETLNLDIDGLTDLGSSAVYEGWIIVDGDPISTGAFSVDANGELSQTSFEVDASMLADASAFVLTIEPSPDADPAPSEVHILAGDFSGTDADLAISHSAAIGTSFTSATGQYLLATPTTTTDEDELSGVWFLKDPQTPALNIPDLSDIAGWTYEGWAVIDGTPVSSGTFEKANGADNEGPFSGTEPGPPFPGEDFVENAPAGLSFPTDLSGAMIVISIEPVPDNDPAPFLLKPLAGEVPANAAAATLYDLDNIAESTYPTGSASR